MTDDPNSIRERLVLKLATAYVGQRDWSWQSLADAALAELASELGELDRLRAELDTVREFCAERQEVIAAINNCHPDNHADYHRWQGHAEARRQLSQRLGLPVCDTENDTPPAAGPRKFNPARIREAGQ